MYAERDPPELPPCERGESCRVELVSENEDAARVYMLTRGQVITRHNGRYDTVTDINHLAVWAMIDGLGIKDRLGTFLKVIQCFNAYLHKHSEKINPPPAE